MAFTFRNAERKDTALILKFIRELANYEKCWIRWLRAFEMVVPGLE